MGSRKQETTTPRSGESEVTGEERRHNDRMELGILIVIIILVEKNGHGH